MWQSNIFIYVQYFFEYFSFLTYIRFTTWNVYLVFCFFAFFLNIFVYSTFFLFLFSLGKKSKNLTSYTSWVLEPVRWIITLFSTFLFIPMLEILFSVFACVSNSENQKVHYIFTEINCWEATHLVISVINALSLLLFLVFIVIAVLLYFESSITSNGCISKKDGVLNLLFLFILFIYVIFETFIDNYTLQIFVFLAGAVLFFFKLRLNPPFLNENISIIWLVNATFLIWTAIMAILSYVFFFIYFVKIEILNKKIIDS